MTDSLASRTAVALAALLAVGISHDATAADPVADFYKGKQMRVIIGFAAGGGYDLYARLIAAHMPRHLPGNPTIVPQNMPGAGTAVATQYMLQKAPRDGTVLATISKDSPFDQVVNNPGGKQEFATLNWVGNTNEANNVMTVWAASGIKSIEDARKKEVVMGTTAATGAGSLFPRVLNNVLGTRFKIIAGFPGSTELNLAMERGEIDGRASDSIVGLKASKPEYLSEKKVNILMQMGFERDTTLPDVPLMTELARTPAERKLFEMLSSGVRIGYPIVTAPEVPADRLAALRRAFDAVVKDPQFLADAARAKLDINPVSGQRVQAAADTTMNASQDVIDIVLAASTGDKTFNCNEVAKDKNLCGK